MASESALGLSESDQFDVPVALFVFNRPDVSARVFAEVARVRPRQLFLICDGARASRAGEAERVQAVRRIVTAVTWPCDVRTNFADSNQGCKVRVSSGISWVFEHVDRAVILEDDCLPSPAFFRYCREMLLHYEDDMRVFAVSGTNLSGVDAQPAHYYSNFSLMWGWATWRSRWACYRLSPDDYVEVLRRMWWRRPVAWMYWTRVYRSLARGDIDTWDYQWILTVWRNSAVCVRPTVNLVRNIGFGVDATHTTNRDSELAAVVQEDPAGSFGKPPPRFEVDVERDRIDEQRWALISWRSVALMCFPILKRFGRSRE
jgi:hypothetical protein